MCIKRQAGISLIELVLFIVVVSIGIAGILSVMNITTRHSADPLVRKQALAIAESMLEEIELKDFANPSGGFTGAPVQANRTQFDDVSDYNGFSTTGIYTMDGVAVGGLSAYSVSVTVASSATLGGISGGEAKLVTITVTEPGNEAMTLEGYRTNYAP
jgi:MSHA pilin protein MshD